MRRRHKSSSGFTFIELLVTCSVIGVLAMISISNFSLYKKRAYDMSAERLLADTLRALEAGKMDIQESALAGTWFNGWTNADGVLEQWPNTVNMVPGLKLDTDLRLNYNYDGWCTEANISDWCEPGWLCCQTDWIEVRHCNGETVTSWQRWNNGEVWIMEWENWPCV